MIIRQLKIWRLSCIGADMEEGKAATRCPVGIRLYYRYAAALAIHSERVSQMREADTLEESQRVRGTLRHATINLAATRREYWRHIELHHCRPGDHSLREMFGDVADTFEPVWEQVSDGDAVTEAQEWSAEAGCAV